MKDIFNQLVYVGHLTPTYVLDEMDNYLIPILIEGLYLSNKESWEQTRELLFMTAQVNSTKKLKPEDLMKFPWDSYKPEFEKKPITEEDRIRLEEKAELFKRNLNGNSRRLNSKIIL